MNPRLNMETSTADRGTVAVPEAGSMDPVPACQTGEQKATVMGERLSLGS